MVGTAIRNSTRCAGRRGRTTAGTTRAVPDCSTNHDSADHIVVNSYNPPPTHNSINIFFYFAMCHKTVIYFIVYKMARQKGATRFLIGATWLSPAGCPMGNLIFLEVVKAWCGEMI